MAYHLVEQRRTAREATEQSNEYLAFFSNPELFRKVEEVLNSDEEQSADLTSDDLKDVDAYLAELDRKGVVTMDMKSLEGWR